MATFVLSTVGTALGGPVGGFIGSMLGTMLDQQIVAALSPNQPANITQTGPRLTEMSLTSSTEGAVIPKLYGRCRMGGQVIWCTQFREEAETTTTEQATGGKGRRRQSGTTTTTVYKYYLSFAVAFCAGNPMAQLGDVWIDSKKADLAKYTIRFYPGSQTQAPDPLIQAIEGAEKTPAYRGTCYIVFEEAPLEDTGNRMPQVTAEIIMPLETDDEDDLSNAGRAWQMIPGSGEAVLGSQVYTRVDGYIDGAEFVESSRQLANVHNARRQPDFVVSTNQLMAEQPNLNAVSLVVTWFGTDLRAGHCRIVPKVEDPSQKLEPVDWAVGELTYATAKPVSRDAEAGEMHGDIAAGPPFFGGTPSDQTVREAIRYLRANGKRVMLYPFIMMDVPPGNTLPDPWSDNASKVEQPPFPWRGRITCSPAPGFAGSPDKTAAAKTQIDTLFQRPDGGMRAFILHYARIAEEEGVNAFCIGSELVGLTSVRSGPGAGPYPAVDQLCLLADLVRAEFKGKIGYAADWSEYHSHRPDDGSGDVIFHLDKLWARASIDFVGIDNYLPLSDWRDGTSHRDYDPEGGAVTIYDCDYLRGNIEGGEYYDWYYAGKWARDHQLRTVIADGHAANEPWVFRQKDIRNWWANSHRNRPGGVRAGTATAWVPGSKPVWFTELGCPAVDKGTNQPNVFHDPKSSESAFPHFSSGARDDLIQRLYAEVMLGYWREEAPASSVYDGPMVEPRNMFVWAWDARPYPDFPRRRGTWRDGALWHRGHWLTGRLESAMLPRLVERICREVGLDASQIDVSGLYGPGGLVRGLLLNSAGDHRGVIETLAKAYQFDAFESGGKLRFQLGVNTPTAPLDPEDLVLPEGQAWPVAITRAQEIELPRAAKVTWLDEANAYAPASVDGQMGSGSSRHVTMASFPLVMDEAYARALANSLIHRAWAARESGEFALPPSQAALEPGDAVLVPVGGAVGGAAGRFVSAQIKQIDVGAERRVAFGGFDASLFAAPGFPSEIRLPVDPAVFSSVRLIFLDLPLMSDAETLPHAPRVAAFADPWPGAAAVYRDDGAGGFRRIQTVFAVATIGELASDLWSGPLNRWDRVNSFRVRLHTGGFASVSEAQLLGGAEDNLIAVRNAASRLWEVLQFARATLVAPGVYELRQLLRGQLGTADAMGAPVPAGAAVVVLEPGAVVPLNLDSELAATKHLYRWGPAQYPASDETFIQAYHQGTRRGLRPYAPCDVRLRRIAATDDLVIGWKRRARLQGDDWEREEVPLVEESEKYRLRLLWPGGAVARTVIVTAPSYTWTAAEQVADFATLRRYVRVRIEQYGAAYGGWGTPFEDTVYMGSAS